MKKSEVLEALASLGDNDEVAIGIIVPKEESFEMGSEGSTSEETDDDGSIDNGDGTVTDFHEIDFIEIVDDTDENDAPVKFASLFVDMASDEDDDDEDENEDED